MRGRRPLLALALLLVAPALSGCASLPAPAAGVPEPTPGQEEPQQDAEGSTSGTPPTALFWTFNETFENSTQTLTRDLVLEKGHWLCFEGDIRGAGDAAVFVDLPKYRNVTLLDTSIGLATNESMEPGVPGTIRVTFVLTNFTGDIGIRVEKQG